MKKTSIRTRTLAPAVVLAVGALVATPAIATTTTGADQTPDTTATPDPAAEAKKSADTEAQDAAEASTTASPETAEQGAAATQEPEKAASEEPESTEEAAVSPTVTFPNHPSGEVDRDAGESLSIKVGYEGVQSLDPITVYVNGEKVEHGEGYEAIQQTDYHSGGFWLRLDGAFMDAAGSASDTVEVRVGEARSTIQVNEIAEDPADISPSVEMDYPLQPADVASDGIEVRVKTAPNAEVDVSKVSVLFNAGYTLSPEGDWNGTADDNGDFTFTISPDTEITSTFDPSRNTTVGQLQDGDGVVVQIRSNGKNTSFATEVKGDAEQPAEPTVEFPDHPNNAAERTIGEDFTATVAHSGATEGDEVRVVVNGNTQTHGEGTYEAPATVTEADGEFQVTLPAEFLDDVRSGTNADQDVLQVRVGTTRNHIRITEVETDPTEDPTDDPTEDPTDDPTEDPTADPTEDPTDDPTDEPTEGPSDDPSDNPSDGDDDEQSAPALTIEPDRISMSDFVDPDRGVTLTVTGLEPGDDVEFGVDPTSGQNVDPATLPAVATDEGVASTVVYGVSSADATSYIGDFDVTVDGIDDAQVHAGSETAPQAAAAAAEDVVGSFTVLSDEDAEDEQDGDRDEENGGDERGDDDRDGEAGEDDGSDNGSDSDDSGNGDDTDRDRGKDLPRTGGEFGGLAVGGVLLAVGAAAVIVTRRRMHQR